MPDTSTVNNPQSHPSLETWLGSSDDSRLHQYIASVATLPGSGQYRDAEYRGTPPSVVETSQYFVGGTEVTTNDSIPGLSHSAMSGPTESVATSMGARDLDQRQRLLIPDGNQGGALTADPQTLNAMPLECPFKIIFGCRLIFSLNHEEPWINHSFAHFKTINGRQIQPPKTNKCCFCDLAIQKETGVRSWTTRLEHIREVHYLNGFRMAAARPDFELVRYLWGGNAIDRDAFRDWTARQSNDTPPSSPDNEYLPPVTNVQERRSRDRRRASRNGRR